MASDILFKIGTTALDLGIAYKLNYKLITSKEAISSVVEGQGSTSIKMLGSYLQYNIEGAIISDSTTITNFIDEIKESESQNKQCYIKTPYDTDYQDSYVYHYDLLRDNQVYNKLYYVLVINQGKPI